MTTRERRPSIQVMVVWLAAVLFIGALAACTQATDAMIPTASDRQETLSGEANSAQTETTPAVQDPQDAALAYSQCIRENGVPEFPDPDSEGRIRIALGSIDPESAVWREAGEACLHLAPEGWGEATTSPGDAEVMLEFARCMRENGLPDYPDPDPNAGVQLMIGPESERDPNVRAALASCEAILQKLQGGIRIGG